MLKPLTTLIKVNRAQLDEKRKELALILDQKQLYIDTIRKMEEEIKSEGENLMNLEEDFRPMFLAFIEATRRKEGILLDEIDKLNPFIEKATEEISILFSETKKYEIVKENRELEIELELQRKTQLEVDEIALMNHVRNNPAPAN